MNKSSVTNGVQEIVLDSWKDFFSLATDEFSKTSNCIYRGQTNFDWPLLSSLDRLRKKNPRRKNLSGGTPDYFNSFPLSEENHLRAFKRAILGRRGPNPPTLTEDEWWALGQHHGLATPLLDWTYRPWIALFFAFDQETIVIDGIQSEPKYRGVFMANADLFAAGSNETQQTVRTVSSGADANFRLVSQAALFLRMPENSNLEEYVREVRSGNNGPRAALKKIKIPNLDRDGCLVALQAMNLTYATLFPDIDGAARHVNSLWLPGHEELSSYMPSDLQPHNE